MAGEWHFQPLPKNQTIREPIAEAFFASDIVSAPGLALVREGIQNSLDSVADGKKTLVRISLVEGENAPAYQQVASYFDDAWAHYEAEDSGLRRDEVPEREGTCPLLVFEDFGTNGLCGDPGTPFPPKVKSENNFFHFFRAEGRTDKDDSKRGSWGLGKDTFFRASRINTVFGFTIREDDRRRMLMGKSVLKSHYAGDDCCQDGYFGVLPNQDGLVVPIEDHEALEQFAKLFRLERRDDFGLSIVVPWLVQEITEQEIIQAVFQNYFYTILSGELDVMVEMAGIETWLDKNSLPQEARRVSDDAAGWLPLIEMAQWATQEGIERERFLLNKPDSGRGWAWSRELLPDDVVVALKEKLQKQEHIAIRVPVTVRKKGEPAQESHFDVYMQANDSKEPVRPTFIREGIVISAVSAPPMPGYSALVVVAAGPLSAFLRQSENPSHTLWQGHQLKKGYVSGVGDLRFIVQSVRQIISLLSEEDKEEDKQLLADLFPIPGQGGKGRVRPLVPPIPTQPAFFTFRSDETGFSITQGRARLQADALLEIHAAYDTRTGNPLSKWRPEDFQLDQPPMAWQSEGCEVIEAVGNRIVIRIAEPDRFRLAVDGFDRNRQVFVDTRKLEE